MQIEFARWWSLYPRKVNKKKSQAIWDRIKPDSNKLIADIQNRIKNDRQWIRGYPPNPTTYLNGERWNDEVQAIPQQVEKVPTDHNKIEAWAKDKGLREPRPGESLNAYHAALTRMTK